MLAKTYPLAAVTGMDADGEALSIARLPETIAAAGLTGARQTLAINTPLGTMVLYRAVRPQ